jgi:hypothetical protein
MARTRRGPHTQAIAYVAGRTKPTAGLAQLSASPTGHPPMSPTGHQSCRGTFLGRRRSISLIATRQLLPSISKTYLALVR